MSTEDGSVSRCEVLIVGGGMSGIAMAATLAREGIDDYLLLERADGLGGTWFHNTYPGCACDIPSALYSFGFQPNPEWTRLFAPRSEILRYLQQVAEDHGITRRTRLKTEVLDARWSEERRCWSVQANSGVFECRWLMIGTGSLHASKMADIPGTEEFQGQLFHSSQWPAGWDGSGERIAVIGTGASAIQLTPALVETAERVHLFQRTPAWIQPRPNLPHGRRARALFRRYPGAQRALRGLEWGLGEVFMAGALHPRLGKILELIPRAHLRVLVRDRELRRKLTPDYDMGCKRLLVSSDFYPALQRSNCELIDSPVARITPRSVIAANGAEREVDAIVFATGFHFGVGPVADLIRGRGGQTLAQAWHAGPSTHLGTSVPGFPNMALLWGPNTGTACVAVSIEAQTRYVREMLRASRTAQLEVLEVHPEPAAAFGRRVAGRLGKSVFASGCSSFYLDEHGNNILAWPGTMIGMWRRMSRFDQDAYDHRRPTDEGAPRLSTTEAHTGQGEDHGFRVHG